MERKTTCVPLTTYRDQVLIRDEFSKVIALSPASPLEQGGRRRSSSVSQGTTAKIVLPLPLAGAA
jgi:hypothetical protein